MAEDKHRPVRREAGRWNVPSRLDKRRGRLPPCVAEMDVKRLKAVRKHTLISKHGTGCLYLTVIPSGRSAFIAGKM